jgi:hypothetical protein
MSNLNNLLNNLIKICIFSFLLLTGYQANAAAPSCVTSDFYKIGDYDSPPGQRIFYFEKLKGALETALDKGEADKAECLYNFYDRSAEAETGFWLGKAAAEGCDIENPSACPDPETPRSLNYLKTMHAKLETNLKGGVEALQDKTEAAAACTEGCGEGQGDEAALAAYLQNGQCCGTKEATVLEEMGTVRNKYPGISYLQCLDKTDKTKKRAGALSTMGSCVLSAVTQVFKGMLDGVTSFFSLPGQLIAARAQIWDIITDTDARNAFFAHIKDSVLEFIGVQSGELTNCLNDEAKTTYYCENVGEVIGFLASPAIIGNLFKVAKLGVKAAASLMQKAMASTTKGAAILAKLNKAKKVISRSARVTKVVAKKKIAGVTRPLKLTVKTSKVAQMIITKGSPIARGMAKATKVLFSPITGTAAVLAPVAKVGVKLLALPARITDKAIIAGFNLGKKGVVAAAGKGKQIITAVTTRTAAGAGAVATAEAAGAGAAAGKTGAAVVAPKAPTTVPAANPFVGLPPRNLRVNLTGTEQQLARLETQIAASPTDAALIARRTELLDKKKLLDEALAPPTPKPTPVERIRDGSTPLFQGTPKEVATAPQVKAAATNIGRRSKRGGEAEVRSYVAGERERLNGLLSKYDQELRAIAGEAKEVRSAKIRAVEAKIKTARQQLDALEQAERNLQYRQWQADEGL